MNSRDPDPIFMQLNSQQLVHTLLKGECEGEPLTGQVAVAYVVQNRAEKLPLLTSGRGFDDRFDYRSVILKWAQFSCMWPTLGGADFLRVKEFATRVLNAGPYSIIERQLAWVATGVVSNDLIDPSHGATSYYAISMEVPPQQPPSWAATMTETILIGHHRFFK